MRGRSRRRDIKVLLTGDFQVFGVPKCENKEQMSIHCERGKKITHSSFLSIFPGATEDITLTENQEDIDILLAIENPEYR